MPVPVQRRWTRAEVEQLIADNPLQTPRYELVDGELFVTPSPAYIHQRAAGEFYAVLREYVRAHGLGRVYFSPSDIKLEPETLVQPDLYVIPPHEDRRLVAKVRESVEVVTLAVEILSPSSVRGDRGRKRLLYQRHIPEYWIVDLEDRLVERWRAGDERPDIERSTLAWTAPGATAALTIDLVELFAEVHLER